MRFEAMTAEQAVLSRQRLAAAVRQRCRSGSAPGEWLTVREASRMLRVPQDDVELAAFDVCLDGHGSVELVGGLLDGPTGDWLLEWISA